jgi:hypothetical protein
MQDEMLGKNLIEISEALLNVESNDATFVLGWPDDLKLRSSMTLFALANPGCPVFRKVLDKFFNGDPDRSGSGDPRKRTDADNDAFRNSFKKLITSVRNKEETGGRHE